MRATLSMAVVGAVLMTGCNKSPEGGEPNTTNTFTISAPTMPTTIKQDNRESVTLTLKRGKDFKQSVKLAASSPTDKVKAELNKTAVAPSDPGDVSLTLQVAKDAPLGDHTIHVTATPDSGQATSVDVKIKVEKNP